MFNFLDLNIEDLYLGELMGILVLKYLYIYQKEEYNKNGICVLYRGLLLY